VTAALEVAAGAGQLSAADRARLFRTLTAAVAALDAPLRVWHGGRGGPSGRPRGTWLAGAALPAVAAALAADEDIVRLVTDRALPALPVPAGRSGTEWPAALRLLSRRRPYGRLLVVRRWPAVLRLDWTAPLAADPAVLAVVLAVTPVPAADAERLLRRRVTALGSTAALAERRRRVPEPALLAALRAASELRERLAAGRTALLTVRACLALAAEDRRDLAAGAARLAAALAAAGSGAALGVPLFEQGPGWSALAGPVDHQAAGGFGARLLDAASVAASIPLPRPALLAAPRPEPAGRLGTDPETGAPVDSDRWSAPNPARIVVGGSGSGKSYTAKLTAHRWLRSGGEVVIVDPEGEYLALAARHRGTVLRGGPDPLAVAGAPALPADEALTVLSTVVGAFTGGPLGPAHTAALDLALTRLRGFPGDRRPGLADLLPAVEAVREPAGRELATRLRPLVTGTLAGLLGPAPAVDRPVPLLVADLAGTPDRFRPAVAAALLGWVWARSASHRARRRALVVVDEAHLLLGDPPAARLLEQFARRARKYGIAVDLLTQRYSDFLDRPPGPAIAAGAATRLLLGCAEPERSAVAAALGLTDGERALLGTGRPGFGLLLTHRGREPVQISAGGPDEHAVAADWPGTS
jgi:hypothetical protein